MSNSIIQGKDGCAAGTAASGGAPAPGGAAAPLLDKEGRNVPHGRGLRPVWNKKQWTIRRTILDRLRFWILHGYQCLWVTLTSAPDSPKENLRKNFQALKKRVDREFGFGFVYVCVDTIEGHGVLHMIWAWKDPDPRKKASFYIPFEWLQEQWNDIHGAFHVNVQRIRSGDKSARRLSRYIVAQYCGGQSGVVRLSQSRPEVPFAAMRASLLREMRRLPERYEAAQDLLDLPPEDFDKAFHRLFWVTFRAEWENLAAKGSCCPFGVQLAWVLGELVRV